MVMVTLSLVMAVCWLIWMASSFSECTYATRSTWAGGEQGAQRPQPHDGQGGMCGAARAAMGVGWFTNGGGTPGTLRPMHLGRRSSLQA